MYNNKFPKKIEAPQITSIRGFTQHGLTDAHDPYLASRSSYPKRITTYFLLIENLHLEHHLFPEIPSYNLPALNALNSDRFSRKVAGKSYIAFLGKFFKRTLNMDESPAGLTSIHTDSVQKKAQFICEELSAKHLTYFARITNITKPRITPAESAKKSFTSENRPSTND